jgi:CRISPR-associated protein (Cas_Cmr5)
MIAADNCLDGIESAKLFNDAWAVIPGFGATVQRCGLLQALAFLRRHYDPPKDADVPAAHQEAASKAKQNKGANRGNSPVPDERPNAAGHAQAPRSVYWGLSNAIREHLARQGMLTATTDDLIDVVKKLKDDEYMIVTREVLALSVWLKREAQARKNKKA